jgi:hypothetical protein
VFDREKRRAFLAQCAESPHDDDVLHAVREKLSLLEDMAAVHEYNHIVPLSMSAVMGHAILPSAARYSSFLHFVENRRALVIQYTKQCNCRCSHCLANAVSTERNA